VQDELTQLQGSPDKFDFRSAGETLQNIAVSLNIAL